MRYEWIRDWRTSAAVLLSGAALLASGCRAPATPAAAASPSPLPTVDTAALHDDTARLKATAPDQAHAMADVGYQFANLWFAGQKENWPLAQFCFDETRSHLNWAVRIRPVRKTPAGEDLDLKGILDALDTSVFADLRASIEAKDRGKFTAAYKQALVGCYSCHKASGKPFLRPQIPLSPAASILNFDPAARWPE